MRPSHSCGDLLQILSFSILILPSFAQDCWYPDGSTQATSDVACNSNAQHSACCSPNAFCLGNGLCYQNGVTSRGSCTDKSWSSGSCSSYCRSDDFSSGGAIIASCWSNNNTFICGDDTTECTEEPGRVFTMTDANEIVLRPDQASTNEDHLTTIAPTSVLSVSSDGDGKAKISSSSGDEFSTLDMVGVGVGVGAPLLLALLGTIFVIISQRRKLNTMRTGPFEEKQNPATYTPVYSTSPSPQPQQAAPYGGYDYRSLQHAGFQSPRLQQQGVQGYFRENQVNELDSQVLPQELDSAKPRH